MLVGGSFWARDCSLLARDLPIVTHEYGRCVIEFAHRPFRAGVGCPRRKKGDEVIGRELHLRPAQSGMTLLADL